MLDRWGVPYVSEQCTHGPVVVQACRGTHQLRCERDSDTERPEFKIGTFSVEENFYHSALIEYSTGDRQYLIGDGS
jgi:hypothetical protein